MKNKKPLIPTRWRVVLILGAGTLALVPLMILASFIAMRVTQPSPEELRRYGEALPVDYALLQPARETEAPAPAGPVSHDAATTTGPLAEKGTKPVPAPQSAPRRRTWRQLLSPYVEPDDFWEWTKQNYPKIYNGPRIEAFRDLERLKDANIRSHVETFIRQKNEGTLTRQSSDFIYRIMDTFYEKNARAYELLDQVLDGGPLIWPPVDEVANLRRSWIYDSWPDVRAVRQVGCSLILADAAQAPEDGQTGVRNLIRAVQIDRRLGIEHPYPSRFWANSSELDVLLEIIDAQRAGLIRLDRISPPDAQEFLTRLPNPMLEHPLRQHEHLRVWFAIDRKIYADREAGFRAFTSDLNFDELIFPFSEDEPFLVGVIKGPLRMVEMRIMFLAGRESKLRDLFAIQQKIDRALRTNAPVNRQTLFEAKGTVPIAAANYLRMCKDFTRIDDRNEIRVLVHAVMIARAKEADPDAALAELADLSRDYADGGLEAVHEDGVCRITLGDRLVLVPPFEADQESTGPRADDDDQAEVQGAESDD